MRLSGGIIVGRSSVRLGMDCRITAQRAQDPRGCISYR